MKKSFFKRISILAVCLLAFAVCAISLFGCAPKDSDVEYSTMKRGLYLSSTAFLEDGETIVAYVAFSGEEKDKLDGVEVDWNSTSGVYDVWYDQSKTDIVLAPSTIFSAVNNKIPQEERILNGVEYSVLKVYLRYDTIYKSIKSDAQSVLKAGNYYVHLFDIDSLSDTHVYALHLKQQNSASWYSVLIACSVIVCVMGVSLYLLIKSAKGGLWHKKKTTK